MEAYNWALTIANSHCRDILGPHHTNINLQTLKK